MKHQRMILLLRCLLLVSTIQHTASFMAIGRSQDAVSKATSCFAESNGVIPASPDTVAIVTGGSRGIGKGIALELAADDASKSTVIYVIGRSSRKSGVSTEREVDEECTVERTCDEIYSISDGRAIGVPVVMSLDASPANDKALYDLVDRIRNDHGRLDVIVGSAFCTPPNLNDASFRDDFWKQGSAMWDVVHDVGLRGQYLLACAAAPLMIDTAKTSSKRPAMFFVSSFGAKSYTFNVAYGVGKAATDRLAADTSVQLAKHNVDTSSLYPGIVRTEGNVAMAKRGEWDKASGGLDLDNGESPRRTSWEL